MDKTYLFYDLETTSRNHCFGQILQFAAIRTDLELNELERHEVRVKLNIDAIPDPEAVLTHKMTLAEMREGESEYDAIKKIHALVNYPGTISGGYNSLKFDDLFLRFSFYRNFLDPYSHQWDKGCGRFDIMQMAIYFYVSSKRDIIQWVKDEEPSLKLEHLKELNQLTTGSSHNAMVDVEATLALAKRFFAERKTWDYVIGCFNKDTELQKMQKNNSCYNPNTIALMVGKSSKADGFQAPLMCLGDHKAYRNQTRWLRLDKPDLSEVGLKDLQESGYIVSKKIAESGFVLPYEERFLERVSPERKAQTERNLDWLKSNPHHFEAIKEHYTTLLYPEFENVDVDALLYKGFISTEDKELQKKFHTVSDDLKAKIIEEFRDPRLKDLSIRLMGRHFPEHLPAVYLQRFQEYVQSVYTSGEAEMRVDYRGKDRRLSYAQMVKQIQEIRADETRTELTPTDFALLSELETMTAPVMNVDHNKMLEIL